MMMVCFGASWPFSIYKSWRARSTKGKSLLFLIFILIGYLLGIVAKFITGTVTYAVFFYAANFVMVAIDLGLYIRNSRLS